MMRARWWIAGLALGLLCGTGGATAAEVNQPPEGFTALFNGKDLSGWKGLIDVKRRATLNEQQTQEEQTKADEKMRAHWIIKDGVLTYDGKGDSLQSAKDYGNFEMYVDWRIQKGVDSGIYLRGNPQVQIWDNPEGSGALWNNKKNPNKPLAVADKPVGEWNTFHIKMVGDRVTIKLNDKLVVDNTPLENYWFPDQPLPAKGPIELQHHGDPLEFRNIFIRELPEAAAKAAPPAAVEKPVSAAEKPAAQEKNAAAAPPAPAAPALLSLELTKVKVAQVVQILAATSTLEIILKDPDGKLSSREVSFISFKNRTVDKALEILCSAVGMEFSKDKSGVYYLSAKR